MNGEYSRTIFNFLKRLRCNVLFLSQLLEVRCQSFKIYAMRGVSRYSQANRSDAHLIDNF